MLGVLIDLKNENMSSNESLDQKKIKDQLLELASKDLKRQINAVRSLKVCGNETVIDPLLRVLVNHPAPELEAEIMDLLNTPKSSKVPAEIAKALTSSHFIDIRLQLLTSIWNSGLDYRPYLTEIVTAGVEGDMMHALECITIIENIEDELSEDQLFEPILVLTNYIASHPSEKGPKMDLIREMTQELQNRNNLL